MRISHGVAHKEPVIDGSASEQRSDYATLDLPDQF